MEPADDGCAADLEQHVVVAGIPQARRGAGNGRCGLPGPTRTGEEDRTRIIAHRCRVGEHPGGRVEDPVKDCSHRRCALPPQKPPLVVGRDECAPTLDVEHREHAGVVLVKRAYAIVVEPSDLAAFSDVYWAPGKRRQTHGDCREVKGADGDRGTVRSAYRMV